ncbi:MAG TPA: hypothetical protein VK791_05360 [bacterium]|nr:hypothetical protein [bacterium]
MNASFEFFGGFRYLHSKRKHSTISGLAWISVIGVAIVTLSGCYIRSVDPISADDVIRSYKRYKKVDEEKVKIYASLKFAPRNYVTVAQLKTNEEHKTLESLMKVMQKKASALHANAVVFLSITPKTTGYPYVENEKAKPLNKVVASATNVPTTERIIGENSVATGTQFKKEDGVTVGNTYDPMTNSRHYYSFNTDGSPKKDEGYRGCALAIYCEEVK